MKKTNYFFALIFFLLINVSDSSAQQNVAKEQKTESVKDKKIIAKEVKKIDKLENVENDSIDYEIKPENDLSRFNNIAVVQALNKTTAKTSIIDLKIGEKISFGSLKIIAYKCWQSPLEQKPENKILLEIFEFKNESEEKSSEKRIFYGWMFSSSPSISGLEHPIYDIIALNCKNK